MIHGLNDFTADKIQGGIHAILCNLYASPGSDFLGV